MSSELAIRICNLSKRYLIYRAPSDRLKQFIFPRLQRLMGLNQKQYYSEFYAIKNISVDIRKGETVGIIGRNGSGKSTLLQVICGTLAADVEAVTANGRIAALLELGSGFNPQFTGRENVYMNGAVLGLSKAEIDARFHSIEAFADIGDFIDRPVNTYSSGMVVRLAFSVAINVDPEILVVDEALSVGDELFQRKCFSRIQTIKDAGTTILFVSHSASQVIDLCDRAILLDDGELLAVGVPKQVVAHYQKLLYAPSHSRGEIRDAIKSGAVAVGNICDVGDASISVQTVADAEVQVVQETFDPNFLPVSTVVYESLGAVIGQPRLLTLAGAQVNGLIRGRRYRHCFKVRFESTVTNVRFGMLIKSMSGLPIGGALSAPTLSESLAVVVAGTEIGVEFAFNCYANEGTYFMNAGAFGCIVNGEETVLHRKSDVLAFRVLPVARNIATEIIDFGFESEVVVHG